MTRFIPMAVLGGVLSLAISLGLIALVFAAIVAVLPAIAWRSLLALSGALVGWGAVWTVVIGGNYVRCVSMGPNCGGGEGVLAFAAIGAVVLLTGLALGWLAIRQTPAREGAPPS